MNRVRRTARLLSLQVGMTSAVAAALVVIGGPNVHATTSYKFGDAPGLDIYNAAAYYQGTCSATADIALLQAAMMAPIFGETGAGTTGIPSPMTHGRYDNQASLYSGNPNKTGDFFYAGIGMWQLDSAGLGSNYAAWEAINTQTAAMIVAQYAALKICSASSSSTPLDRARKVWGWNGTTFSTWYACNVGSSCTNFFNASYLGANNFNPPQKFTSVTSLGGMETHSCRIGSTGSTFNCYFVNFLAAQGDTSFMNNGANPVPKPHYSWRSGTNEKRDFWALSGWANMSASRPFNTNARGHLTWSSGKSLCDLTIGGYGNC